MAGYKQTRIQYPPCMAEENLETRKLRFLRHLAMAYTNCNYGSDAAAFDKLNRQVQQEWSYNFLGKNGRLQPLDLERLDAAEALVFWLGGFPIPLVPDTKQPIANRRLFGFHRDEDDPFKRDAKFEKSAPLQFRTDPLFSFDETRLTDHDHDGWWEFVPYGVRDGETPPPYVYFDGGAYVPEKTDPTLLGTCLYPRDAELAGRWGTATPIAKFFDPQQKAIIWNNESGIQIICAGLDFRYGPTRANSPPPMRRIVTWPEPKRTFLAQEDFRRAREYDESELDNLTNLSVRPLGSTE